MKKSCFRERVLLFKGRRIIANSGNSLSKNHMFKQMFRSSFHPGISFSSSGSWSFCVCYFRGRPVFLSDNSWNVFFTRSHIVLNVDRIEHAS